MLELDQKTINQLKSLVIDGVHFARSGHPGGAMSSMDFAYILFSEYLSFDPDDLHWKARDRFILSAGHESMLLYSLFYGLGRLELKELKRFRQLHSKTPGHPESFLTPGVECTTGPLGQGCGMSVGFAIGQKHMAAALDKDLFNYKTWVLLGDGCMQECVTLSSASLAGHLKLNNLVWYYDKNDQQISGNINRVTSDNFAQIFAGFNWHVIEISGHDHSQIRQAIEEAKSSTKPTLIIGQSEMAHGCATMQGSHKTHGSPLPEEERLKTKKLLGIPEGEDFYFSDASRMHFQRRFTELRKKRASWEKQFAEKTQKDNTFNKRLEGYFSPELPSLPFINWGDKPVATRVAFGKLLQEWAHAVPNLIGGSADLEPSNMTGGFLEAVGEFCDAQPSGRNLAFGVREFPMSAITNGLALHGGFRPFDATFLSFADYSRAALRLGCLQKTHVIHEFTHDSFYLGEDGPTHQPVEHLMSLRAIPDMHVIRPADAKETTCLFEYALHNPIHASICLSRQDLPILPHSQKELEKATKGAWVIKNNVSEAKLIIFATGSEVSLAIKASEKLASEYNLIARIVSVPCWELFFKQDKSYQQEILAWHIPYRVSIEAGITFGWEKFIGNQGLAIGLDRFGDSAPYKDLEKEYGFTEGQVVSRILGYIQDKHL